MSKSDGVDVKQLLEAIRRRGGYCPSNATHPQVGALEVAQVTTQWVGVVLPQQQVTLKRNAMLILNSGSVTIMLDTDQKRIQFSYNGTPTVTSYQSMLEALVLRVLGPGWVVTCGKLGGNEPGPAEVKENSSQE